MVWTAVGLSWRKGKPPLHHHVLCELWGKQLKHRKETEEISAGKGVEGCSMLLLSTQNCCSVISLKVGNNIYVHLGNGIF